MSDGSGGWATSAEAWIVAQGASGDASRREILDPALEGILGPVTGKSVLDIGCGEGRYARILAVKGALVTGIDPVLEFVEIARRLHPEGRYLTGRAESLPFEAAAFDVILSYLSLIDVPDDLSAIKEMARVLNLGGEVVLVTISNLASTSAEWVKDADGRRLYRTVDRYMECFSMNVAWKGISIVNWHRPLSRTIQAFLDQGMVMTRFLEPLPDPTSIHYEDESRVPTFQIMTFRKDRGAK